LQTYESIFIVPADLPIKRLDDLIEKLKATVAKPGGLVKNVEKWGRRRLAYPIGRHREGFYVLLTFQSPSPVLAELTQLYRVSDDVIRHMTCKAPVPNPVPPRRTMPGAAPVATAAAPAAPAAVPAASAPVPGPVASEASVKKPSPVEGGLK
jgi:small subunit ribosomal protein S6